MAKKPITLADAAKVIPFKGRPGRPPKKKAHRSIFDLPYLTPKKK
jgi:hypothetical protein